MGFLDLLVRGLAFGGKRDVRRYWNLVAMAGECEPWAQSCRDMAFEMSKLKAIAYPQSDENLARGLALVREAGVRASGKRLYDEQLFAACVLHDGNIAEAATGEGKTLVGPAACALAYMCGMQSHVVTVNDYLAERDRNIAEPILSLLGMTLGITSAKEHDVVRKQQAYVCDVVYGTAAAFGFDYLRNNMATRPSDYYDQHFDFALIDEVDSVLIDEARTPLIISGPSSDDGLSILAVDGAVRALDKEAHIEIDEMLNQCTLTESGWDEVENSLDIEGIEDDPLTMALVVAAVRAHFMMEKDVDYIVRDGEVLIVDEFTGRVQAGRRFSDGLHAALEAKEGVKVHPENITIATVTLQNYFRGYKRLSGMSGTALTEDSEFSEVYSMRVMPVRPHRPRIREDRPDKVFADTDSKWAGIVAEIAREHATGRPVLVGTVSVEASEHLSGLLEAAGIKHVVLNAKNDREEAAIIAQAGRLGAVTVATNMAGRGTDIMLGGNPEGLEGDACLTMAEIDRERVEVCKLGGLCVIGTERHDSRRIDNQLRGRAGRQGDPGSSQFFLSLEDDVVRIYSEKHALDSAAKLFRGNTGYVQSEVLTKLMDMSQNAVQFSQKKQRSRTLEFDDVMNAQRQSWYDCRREVLLGNVGADALMARAIALVAETFDGDSLERFGVEIDGDFSDVIWRAWKDRDLDQAFSRGFAHRVYIAAMDAVWVLHLEEMGALRRGIGLRSLGKLDPIEEYKREAYDLYTSRAFMVAEEFLSMMMLRCHKPKNIETDDVVVAEPMMLKVTVPTDSEKSV